ncbi:MAG TPA: hypothetical protein VIK62_05960 [Verrucomicrobiae bacterium]
MIAFVALAFPAAAQQTIIFSKPVDTPADKANAFLPGANHRAGDYNAPHDLFHDYTPDNLPMSRPVWPDANDPSVKAALDRRKNWTLLTPEQILGIQTPEEILGVQDKPEEKKMSLEEKFMLRENRATAMAATNGHMISLLGSERDENNPFAFKNKNDESDPFHQSSQKMELGARYFNQFLNAPDAGVDADGKRISSWGSGDFAQPDQPKQTPEQLADMERFRALMEPQSPPDKVQVPTRFFAPAPPAPDPFLQPAPVVNPNGQGVAPLENAFSKPTGITPLPGISTPAPKPVATKPSWQAQLPPWMTDGPQAHNPNRNF